MRSIFLAFIVFLGTVDGDSNRKGFELVSISEDDRFLQIIAKVEQITPFKYSNDGPPAYDIPTSSRYTYERPRAGEPDIVYYLSSPKANSFPIAVLCTGSSSKGSVSSVIHFHRYFLQECLDLELGVVSVEQWGVDGNEVNENEFMAHYTRSQRLSDHRTVIKHLEDYPPEGWNGQLIFIGVSEGGPLVTDLSTMCPNTLATINWCGAGDWPWADELWQFFESAKQSSFWMRLYNAIPRWLPLSLDIPRTRHEYDALVQHIIRNPAPHQWMGGMTYLYHEDAFQSPPVDYSKIRAPFLVVAGTEDSCIDSSDQFVQKAKEAAAPITYFRIEGMDHYIRLRPDIIQDSFQWLQMQITPLVIEETMSL